MDLLERGDSGHSQGVGVAEWRITHNKRPWDLKCKQLFSQSEFMYLIRGLSN